jgi:hypothetical protein
MLLNPRTSAAELMSSLRRRQARTVVVNHHRGGWALHSPNFGVARWLQRLDLDGCESAPLRIVDTDCDMDRAACGLDPEELVERHQRGARQFSLHGRGLPGLDQVGNLGSARRNPGALRGSAADPAVAEELGEDLGE